MRAPRTSRRSTSRCYDSWAMPKKEENLPLLALHVAAAFAKSIAAKTVLEVYRKSPRRVQRWIGRGAKAAAFAARLLDGK
jgi:hypothetical protein